MKKLMTIFRPESIRELVIILLIIGVALFFSTQIPNYFNAIFINRLSMSVAVVAVCAVAQTLVFLTKNFDLSLGSIVGVTAYSVGYILTINHNIPPVVAFLLAVGVGAFCGVINGILVAYAKVPSIITTIGTMAIYRTLLIQFSNSKTILTANLPQWIVKLAQVNILTIGDLDLRLMVGIMLAVVLIFQLVLSYLPYGRRLYAIGSNPDAARIAGFASQRIIFTAFVLCGSLAGVAGFLFMAKYGNVTVVAGNGLEFSAIAAAVVGGVSNSGGSGTAIGAFLGAILIDLMQNSLIRWGAVSEFWRDAVLGMLILLAVASDYIIMGRLRKIWSQAELEVTTSKKDKAEVEHA